MTDQCPVCDCGGEKSLRAMARETLQAYAKCHDLLVENAALKAEATRLREEKEAHELGNDCTPKEPGV